MKLRFRERIQSLDTNRQRQQSVHPHRQPEFEYHPKAIVGIESPERSRIHHVDACAAEPILQEVWPYIGQLLEIDMPARPRLKQVSHSHHLPKKLVTSTIGCRNIHGRIFASHSMQASCRDIAQAKTATGSGESSMAAAITWPGPNRMPSP
jgi:hypothetical protein